MPGVEPVLIERFLERVELRLRDIDFRFSDLAEIARRHQPGEQADDHHHHEQLDQREAALLRLIAHLSLFGTHASPFLTAILLRPDKEKRALVADSWDLRYRRSAFATA